MTDTHVLVPRADTTPVHGIMHPLVEKMMSTNPTPEALEKLLNLQREWEKGEAKRAFDAALVELKRALPPYLQRDKIVDFTGESGKRTRYTHTTLAAAMETVIPILCDHGFSLTWTPGINATGQVEVTAELTHRQGHSKTAKLSAAADTGGKKSGPQAVASTVTLLERYTALGLLGLSTKDMNEPTGDAPAPAPERVDTARNMRAMSDLAKRGKSKAEVEQFVGKPLQQWTPNDLDKLRAWIDGPPPAAPTGELVSKEQAANLKAIMNRYGLTTLQFQTIIVDEIGRTPKGTAQLTVQEYDKVVRVFSQVEAGIIGLCDGKIIRPQDAESKPVEPRFPKESAEDDDLPF